MGQPGRFPCPTTVHRTWLQVEAEVRDFWGSLEQSTNARQR